MITFKEDTYMQLFIIFKEESSIEQPEVKNVIALSHLMSTYHANNELLGYSTTYWEFLHACLDNIETGIWHTLPRFWVEIVNMTRDTPMSEYQRAAEYRKYLQHRTGVCDRLGISNDPGNDRELLYRWLLNKDGADYILGVSHAIMRMYLYFSKDFFEGVNNNAAYKHTPFTNVDQVIHPIAGGTKDQVLRQNFKRPLKRHERMI